MDGFMSVAGVLLGIAAIVFLVYGYYKKDGEKLEKIARGECPECGAKESVQSRVLQSHGCSGIVDVEYRCSSCDFIMLVKASGGCGSGSCPTS